MAAQVAKVQRQKALCKLMWPFLHSKSISIYDAQTVVNAVGGYLKYELEARMVGITVKDLAIDLKNETDSEIKTAMTHILEVFEGENAKDAADLLERFGKTLGGFSAHTYMKKPMTELKVEDIVS